MDPALLRERAKFKKRALAQPAVEQHKRHTASEAPSAKKHKASHHAPTRPSKPPLDYKKVSALAANPTKFSVLAKIVNFMKGRHHAGHTYPLALDEILDEARMPDISSQVKAWLTTEALVQNPKLEVREGTKYIFKPKLPIRNKKGLLSLLKKNDLKGLGTIYMEDVEEALPQAQKQVERLKDQILVITRVTDKKKILVSNDKSSCIEISEVFRQHWNSASVEGVDEKKVEEYLSKQGIASMQDIGVTRVVPHNKRKKPTRHRTFKKLNDHLGDDTLVDYNVA